MPRLPKAHSPSQTAPNPGQTDARIKGSDPSRAVLHPASAPLESGRNHKKGREGHDSWRELWCFSPRVPKKEQRRCEQEEMDSSELINAVIWTDQQGVGIRWRSLLFTKQRCNKSVTQLKQTHEVFCQHLDKTNMLNFKCYNLQISIRIVSNIIHRDRETALSIKLFLHVTSILTQGHSHSLSTEPLHPLSPHLNERLTPQHTSVMDTRNYAHLRLSVQ